MQVEIAPRLRGAFRRQGRRRLAYFLEAVENLLRDDVALFDPAFLLRRRAHVQPMVLASDDLQTLPLLQSGDRVLRRAEAIAQIDGIARNVATPMEGSARSRWH